MKKIFSLLLLLAFNISVFAQASHTEAKALLNKASEKMRSYDNYYIEFTYTLENNKLNPPVFQKVDGNIAVKGDDFRLNFLGTEQIKSGDKLYTILPEDEEVQITKYEEGEEQGISPTKILNVYQKGFSYKLGGTEKKDGKTIQYVILQPNASEEIERIMVGIDKATSQIVSLQQWGTNKSLTTFTITSFTPNKNFPKDYFKFNRANYQGYYIAE